MKRNKTPLRPAQDERGKALVYIKTLADLAREPFLILDRNLKVVDSNDAFHQVFKVTVKETKGKFVYNLGNKQWNIPKLKRLLEEILPKKKTMRQFEVDHKFPHIGRRLISLNAQQLDGVQLIILAFDDITEKKRLEKKAALYTQELERKVESRTKELKDRVKDLEELTQVMVGRELKMSELKKEIARIKKLKKINHNNHHLP